MAVTAVNEKLTGRTGNINREYHREYTRVFHVQTDDVRTSTKEVREANGIPQLYAPYITQTEQDLAALVVDIDPADREDGSHWDVTVTYSTDFDVDPLEQAENPLLRPPRFDVGSIQVQEAARFDIDKKPIMTSANAWYNPLPTIDGHMGFWTVTKNRPFFSYVDIRNFVNKVNGTAYFGFPSGELRLSKLGARGPNFEANQLFWEVTATFLVKENTTAKVDGKSNINVDGWDLLLPDIGVVEKNGTTGTGQRNIPQEDGAAVKTPWFLNGSGNALAYNFDPATDISYRKFRVYPRVDFNQLNLLF